MISNLPSLQNQELVTEGDLCTSIDESDRYLFHAYSIFLSFFSQSFFYPFLILLSSFSHSSFHPFLILLFIPLTGCHVRIEYLCLKLVWSELDQFLDYFLVLPYYIILYHACNHIYVFVYVLLLITLNQSLYHLIHLNLFINIYIC